MTLGELFGREAKLPAGLDRVPIAGLAADSREVKPGYLFAALPGVKIDGTRFIDDALERGSVELERAGREHDVAHLAAERAPVVFAVEQPLHLALRRGIDVAALGVEEADLDRVGVAGRRQ